MKLVARDTTREAQEVYWNALRRLSPARRVEMAFELSDEMRELTRAGIRARHPEYDGDRVELVLRRILWGRQLFRQVYPDSELNDDSA